MAEFINRTKELRELDTLLAEEKSQLVMMYGRRRVGKTTLLTHWANQTGQPVFYWVAKRDSREHLLANLARTIYMWQHGLTSAPAIQPRDWEEVFEMLAQATAVEPTIIILDELPYALQQDKSLGTHLQAAWDHKFKESKNLLILSGSHIGMLIDLTTYQSPLYGRLTSQFPLQAMTFADIKAFLPNYDVYQRFAVYAILGGVPAYLERWRDQETLKSNVERLFLQRTGWFRNEPMVLVSDLTQRETISYEAILKAIADGHHSWDAIASHAVIKPTSLSHYIPRLLDLQFIDKRVPATTPLKNLKTSRQTRYYLRDSFLRFYYRFIEPNLHLLDGGLSHRLWQMIEQNFRAYVAYMFEEICQQWVVHQAQKGLLPFPPDNVGAHWSKTVQVDVVAINWQEKKLLLGECKWGDQTVSRNILTDLIDHKTPQLLNDLPNGEGWQVHYALFARHGFSEATKLLAQEHQVILRTLPQLEQEMASV